MGETGSDGALSEGFACDHHSVYKKKKKKGFHVARAVKLQFVRINRNPHVVFPKMN